jgi:hypothetical protein
MKNALYWVITQRAVVISYRRPGTNIGPILRVKISKITATS